MNGRTLNARLRAARRWELSRRDHVLERMTRSQIEAELEALGVTVTGDESLDDLAAELAGEEDYYLKNVDESEG